MGLLIGLGFKLGFISILHLPVPRAGLESPTPRSPFSNILRTTVLALYFARLTWAPNDKRRIHFNLKSFFSRLS